MQDLTAVSGPSSLTTSNSLSNSNLLSPLFTALGWRDLKPAITAAEQIDQVLALELQQAYDSYSTTPNEASQQRLQMTLDQVIGELQADLVRVKKLEKEATKRLAKPQTNSSSYLASWGNWMKQSAQAFFSSDDASLVERYAGIAQQRKENIAILSFFRDGLAAQVIETQELAVEQESIIEDIISPASRRLLQTQYPTEATVQFCYPDGACELSALSSGNYQLGLVLEGETVGDISGFSISSAGDLNGDGLDDMVIGAPYADPNGRSGAGKSYVVFGSRNSTAWGNGVLNLSTLMDGSRGFALQGEATNDYSGVSVSSAGDLNGDGLGDMVIGAHYADPSGRSDAGKSYVVFGSRNSTAWGNGTLDLSALMDGRRGFMLQGEAANDRSGHSVSSAGDVNGDGVGDVVLGAPYADPNGRSDAGKSYVVFGSRNSTAWGNGTLDLSTLMDGSRGFALQGEAISDYSGVSVSSAGDLNGDGLDDVVIGAYLANSSGRGDTGKSYVVFGSSNSTAWGNGTLELSALMDGSRGFALQGEAASDYSGIFVSSAGDLNGDGLDDVVIGAYLANSSGRGDTGKSYVVFGSSNSTAWGNGTLDLSALMDGIRGFTLQGEAADDQSGVSVSSAGDVNGDGLDDVVIGAYLTDPSGRSQAGKSYVVFGSNNSIAWGNGTLDLSTLMDGSRGFALQGEAISDYSGVSVSSAGDLNGDGLGDMVIGAHYADPSGRSDAGKSYVVWGRPSISPNSQLFLTQGEAALLKPNLLVAWDQSMVAGTYFVDDTTYGQFELPYQNLPGQAIPWFTNEQITQSEVFFMHDGSDAASSYHLSIPASVGWSFGLTSQVEFSLVQQFQYSSSVELSLLSDGLRGFVLQGEAASDASGYSVSSAGDMNGDGLGDVVIGAYRASPSGRTNAGKSYVVFGSRNSTAWGDGSLELSALMDGIHGFILQGEAASDVSGYSVSSAGDVNGDGLSDLVIGAHFADPSGRTNAGKSYVVFGSSNSTAWGNGTLNLGTLVDGRRGFVLQGEAADDQSGVSVSSAGDVNGDGLSDLVIGAHLANPSGRRADAGKSYVVFGSNNSTMWSNGVLSLSTLTDGRRGFVLQGEAADDQSGVSVSSAGDVNGDGLGDLVIGAYGADPNGRAKAGKSYVVFGSSNSTAWGNGTLELSTLVDGKHGFTLQGEIANDWSGYSVSSGGDVNGDGLDDLVIGAYRADLSGRSDAGKSYIVFGSSNSTAWGNGTLDLSPLMDGRRGFALQGEIANDWSGYSVSSGGDVNGDGLDDLVIGAYRADLSGRNEAGKSYVVLGSRNNTMWGNGTLDLSTLMDGIRGFALQGEAAADYSGVSVSSAGDVNGDGWGDVLIGAHFADPSGRSDAGKSYVVFGGNSLRVSKQQLPLRSGQTLRLGAQHLAVNYADASKDSSALIYTVQSVNHGRFELELQPGFPLATFTQADINQNKVQLVHDGSVELPVYQLQVSDGFYVRALPSLVHFNAHPVFINNTLVLNQSQASVITPNQLAVSDRESPLKYLTLTVTDQRSGRFTWVNGTGDRISSFSALNITAGAVQFVPDGSNQTPEYTLSVSDGVNSYSERGQVDFNRLPTLGNNQLLVDQGQAMRLDATDLSASDPDSPSAGLQFVVSDVQYGQFNYAGNTTAPVSSFTQQAVRDGFITFVHDGSSQVPHYSVAVSDGRTITPSQAAAITFNYAPMLRLNPMTIDQGQATILLPQDISATDVETFDEDITIEATNVTHGYFAYTSNPKFNITAFRQFPLITGGVQFTHDGSNANASFAVRAFDGRIYTPWQMAQTRLNRRPVLQGSIVYMTVEQGKSFSFDLDTGLFSDPDGEPLNYTAQLTGGVPLPKGLEFIPPTRFQGKLSTLSNLQVEVQARDPRGLTAATDFTLESHPQSQSGIDLEKLYASVSSIGGIALAIAGYLWWRRKVTGHRRGFELANNLRKAANLEYHDFMRFDGDVFKSKIENFLSKVDGILPDFYKGLTPAEKKSFAVCITEILEQRKLLKPSGYGMGVYGWMLAFSVGWSQQLDFKKFEAQLTEIAQESVAAWKAEESPTTRWPYFSPTTKDKVNAFCCARPSRAGMFARDKVRLGQGQSVSMMELKHQAPPVSPAVSNRDDIVLSVTATSSSPRFFSSSATSDERLGLIEKQVQGITGTVQNLSGNMQQVSEGMHYMNHGMQQIAGNVKTIHEEVEQLKAETRPLLMGVSSSSS